MHYSVPETAQLLSVTEDQIYDWIRSQSLPTTFYAGRYHIDKLRLIDWAHRNQLALPVEGLVSAPILESALERGGVLDNVAGDSLRSILEEIFLRRIELAAGVGRKICGLLGTRENFGWVSGSECITTPSPRAPLVVLPESSRVYLAYPTAAGGGQVPQALFIFLVSHHSIHLNLLTRCLFALRNEQFKQLIMSQSGLVDLERSLRSMSSDTSLSHAYHSREVDLLLE